MRDQQQQQLFLLHNAADLNERGIRFLQDGNLKDASYLFDQALRMAGGRLQAAMTASTKTAPVTFAPPRCKEADMMVLPPPVMEAAATATTSQVVDLAMDEMSHAEEGEMDFSCSSLSHHFYDDSGYCDKTPVVFVANPWDSDYQMKVRICLCSIYNNALAYHLNSHIEQEDYVDSLSKAIQLYELACRLHMQARLDMGWDFRLKIVNNLGHAYRLLGDEDAARENFEDLLSCILYLHFCDEAKYLSQQCDMDGYFENLACLVLREEVAAAA